MNEHDSERIAGLLESDGYVRASEAAAAEVVVLNTCAVRENADNRLYGALGHLKPLKDRNRRLRIVVAGCLAQKDQGLIQRRAPWVDVVVGTHALGKAPRWTSASTPRYSRAPFRPAVSPVTMPGSR